MLRIVGTIPESARGTIYVVGGILLFLYTAGIVRTGLTYVILTGSFLAVIYGFIILEGPQRIAKLITKSK